MIIIIYGCYFFLTSMYMNVLYILRFNEILKYNLNKERTPKQASKWKRYEICNYNKLCIIQSKVNILNGCLFDSIILFSK